jgi:hypothetical protein
MSYRNKEVDMLKALATLLSVTLLGIVLPATTLHAQQLERSAAIDLVQALRVQQCAVQAAVRSIPGEPGPARDVALQQLRETKSEMAAQLAELEARMDLTPELRSASNTIRESRLQDKLDFSRGTIEHWDDGSENRIEAIIQSDLGAVRDVLTPTTTFACPAPV